MYTCTVDICGGYSYYFEPMVGAYSICGEVYTYINIEVFYNYGMCFYTESRSKKKPRLLNIDKGIIESRMNKRICLYDGVALLYKMYKYYEINEKCDS